MKKILVFAVCMILMLALVAACKDKKASSVLANGNSSSIKDTDTGTYQESSESVSAESSRSNTNSKDNSFSSTANSSGANNTNALENINEGLITDGDSSSSDSKTENSEYLPGIW